MTTQQRLIAVMLPRDLPAARVIPYAQQAEDLGFDELWVVEDLGYRGGFTQAAVVLASTRSIKVGIGILPTGARNVAFAAMEISTLADLFPGRLTVGIGHGMPGWMRSAGAWPSSPLSLLAEQAGALRSLLSGASTTVSGTYVTLDDVTLASSAASDVPIVAGVRGPRSIELAGHCTDGVVLAEPVTPEYLARSIALAGRPDGFRVIGYNAAAVDDDPAAARSVVRPGLAWIGDPDWAPHIAPLDFAEDFAALRATCASRDEFAARMPDAWVDQLAIVGDPASARARIDALHEAGATSIVLIPAGADPLADLPGLARVLHP